jgi:hypothetical protein
MRKFCLIVAVILLAAPAWANVSVTCTVVGNKVTVSYDSTTEARKVRAFALDITISKGVITDVNDNVNSWYTIYPGSINIVDGEVNYPGTAVADPNDHPDTLGGIGTGGITVEMGALYSPPDDANGPPKTGVLLTFTVSDGTAPFCVTIQENDTRGGVVLTDPAVEPVVSAPGCCATTTTTSTTTTTTAAECFPSDNLRYTDWKTLGMPNCWCGSKTTPPWLYQCDGDADNATEGGLKYRVFTGDLNALSASWKKKAGDAGLNPCADFDHKSEGGLKYRVFTGDLNRLSLNWKKKDTGLAGNCPRNE